MLVVGFSTKWKRGSCINFKTILEPGVLCNYSDVNECLFSLKNLYWEPELSGALEYKKWKPNQEQASWFSKVSTHLGFPHPISKCLKLSPDSASNSTPYVCLGSDRWRPACLDPWHPSERLRWSSCWASRSEPTDGHLISSLPLFMSLPLSDIQINKQAKPKKLSVSQFSFLILTTCILIQGRRTGPLQQI